jgi:hypothetical protein
MNTTKGVKPRPEDRRMMARLRQPIIAALLDERCPLPLAYRAIGLNHVVYGEEVPALAALYGMEINEARSALAFVMGWWEGVSHAA